MKRNQLLSLVTAITIILIVLSLIFIHFPFMGHDYSLSIGWANDYQFAWKKFGVFNIIFSPQRCSGVPVWANPIGLNFSLFHILSTLFKDLNVIVIYSCVLMSLSFFGIKKFLSLFELDEPWKSYIAIGWCLQGYITTRAIVGHLPLINLGLWPLYAYLLIKKNNSNKKDILGLIIFSFAFAHDFYMANTYLFVMFPLAFSLFLVIMKINQINIDFKWTLKRLFSGSILTLVIILPKLIAILSFTRNFQRQSSFAKVDLLSSLNYVFMNLITPLPLDYHEMTGWRYGNWESISYIFPFFFPVLICHSSIDFKKYGRILTSLLLIIILGVFISSGLYADFIKNIPIIKSFHVNPRWMAILSLSLLAITTFYLKKAQLKSWIAIVFIVIAFTTPFYFIGQNYFRISYLYRSGLNVEKNRLNYCYEPAFGHKLELLPIKSLKGKYFDPRCFVSKKKCTDYTLKPELKEKLENYSLSPFEE